MELTLPVVHIVAENLPRGWEEAVLACWERGAKIATQYDRPGDPPSRDCILVLNIADPLAEPRIHRAMPGGFDDLEVYRQEVVDGIHDRWIDRTPGSTKWRYTYHERFTSYNAPGQKPVDQLAAVVDALVKAPHTRRAIAITWEPWFDPGSDDPPCVQYLWFRIFGDQLVMNLHIRSNDAYKAAFMNMYALTDLQRVIAERVSERLGRVIVPGQYNHFVDSFHIYGSYFDEFKGFLRSVEERSWDQRTYRTDDPFVMQLMAEAREEVAAKLAHEKEVGR